MKTPVLEVLTGEFKGRRYEVKAGGIKLGRSSSNDIFIPDPELSRSHCIFEPLDSGAVKVTDLASANGTLVNGEEIGSRTVELKPGDIVEAGDTKLMLADGDKPKPPVRPDKPPVLIPEADARDGEPAGAPRGDGKKPKLDLRSLLWGGTVLVLLAALVTVMVVPVDQIEEAEDAEPVAEIAGPRGELKSFDYELVDADSNGIFRFFLTFRGGVLAVEIDEVGKEPRHVTKSKRLSDVSVGTLANLFAAAGLEKLAREYAGPDSEPPVLKSCSVEYTLDGRTRQVAAINTPAPEALRQFREKLETFAKNELSIWALEYSADKLLEMAHSAAQSARTKYEDRDVRYGNLHDAIRNFEEALVYLDTVNPKPAEYARYQEELRIARNELDLRYREVSFQAAKAQQLQDWEAAREQLGIVLDMLVNRDDERYRQAAEALNDIEKRLKKGTRK
ncbi:MAG: FHA domain-containing protein [Kiritimatiellae bacterium]|nr:FHA domain-containing protein [Kiritimatiellia bacterium]